MHMNSALTLLRSSALFRGSHFHLSLDSTFNRNIMPNALGCLQPSATCAAYYHKLVIAIAFVPRRPVGVIADLVISHICCLHALIWFCLVRSWRVIECKCRGMLSLEV